MQFAVERRLPDALADPERVDLLVTGRIDGECGDELEQAVTAELRQGRHSIRLDLTDAGFLSSGGIRVLFNVHRAAKAAGGSCLISAASEPITRVLTLSRLAPILMDLPAAAVEPQPLSPPVGAAAIGSLRVGPVHLMGFHPAPGQMLEGRLCGEQLVAGAAPSLPVTRQTCGLGLAAFADDGPPASAAGEMLAACGAVFVRPPQPFASADSLLGTGDFIPEIRAAAALLWEGLPQGRTGFESAHDSPGVALVDLIRSLLEQADAPTLAVVIVAEVQGLVGAELIRPLGESSAADSPQVASAEIASRWLSFSREPAHAQKTVVIVGIATQSPPEAALQPFVRPLGTTGLQGHLHAAVFPSRPLTRGGGSLTALVDDLAGSAPLAVMHLLDDPQPVLGSGQSELVRGTCWFAPLQVHSGEKR